MKHQVRKQTLKDTLPPPPSLARFPSTVYIPAFSHNPLLPVPPFKQMLRQDARTSQADFLSTVLPAQDFDFGSVPSNGHTTSTSTPTYLQRMPPPPSTPNGPGIDDDAAVASGQSRSSDRAERPGVDRAATAGVAVSSIDAAVGSSVSDKQAVARWASMRRLQEQSVGLGGAADHQLTRALQLCRDLRGLKVRKSSSGWWLATGRSNNSGNSSRKCPTQAVSSRVARPLNPLPPLALTHLY